MPSWLTRPWSLILVILICCTPELLSAASGQQATPVQTEAQSAQSSSSVPDTTVPAQTQSATDTNASPPTPSSNSTGLPNAPSTTLQPNAAQPNAAENQSNNAQDQQAEPAGTAAAQIGKLKGGPASKPAGAAIAPAKQRRVRSLLIKLGVLAGAGAAVGTVYALSHGSPSRPPGAH